MAPLLDHLLLSEFIVLPELYMVKKCVNKDACPLKLEVFNKIEEVFFINSGFGIF
jgi:hypothetical protein